jgi:hypothetical protein
MVTEMKSTVFSRLSDCVYAYTTNYENKQNLLQSLTVLISSYAGTRATPFHLRLSIGCKYDSLGKKECPQCLRPEVL